LRTEALEAPFRRAPARTEPDDAGGAVVELPRPEALVGNRAVAPDLALAHVHVGPDDATVDRVQESDGHLGDGIGVPPRRPQDRDPPGRGPGDVDVGRV